MAVAFVREAEPGDEVTGPMIETERPRSPGPQSDTQRAHRRAAALLRQMAQREPTALPVLSAYLDLRPPADARVPAIRESRDHPA